MRLYSFGLFCLYLLTMGIPSKGQISARPLLQAQPGKPYAVQLGVQVSGTPPFRFSLQNGKLPQGLLLDHDGLITGTPKLATSGDFPFTVLVTDLTGKSIQADFVLRIAKTVPIVYAAAPTQGSAVSTISPPQAPSGISPRTQPPVLPPQPPPQPSATSKPSPIPATPASSTPVSQTAKLSPKIGPIKEGITAIPITIDPQPDDTDAYVCIFPGATTPGKSDCTQPDTVAVQPAQTTGTPPLTSVKIRKGATSAVFSPIQPLACGQVVMLVLVDSQTKERAASLPAAVCGVPAPTLDTLLGTGISFLEGRAAPSILTKGHNDQYDQEVRISVQSCNITAPDPYKSIEGTNASCPGKLLIQPVTDGPNKQDHYVLTDANGAYAAGLQTSIFCKHQKPGTYLFSVVEHDVTSDVQMSSTWVDACQTKALTSNPRDREYNDTDEGFSVIGGVEQEGLSAQPNQTNAFLRAFTRSPPFKGNNSIWATVRLLGAPEASSTANVISATADPSGVLITKNFATVGTAIDYIVGYEWDPDWLHNYGHGGQLSVGFIAGLGATTPLGSQNLALAYTVPALNTTECGQLQMRFTPKYGYNPAPAPGTAASLPGTTTPNTNCLFNTAGISLPAPNSGTAIKTLAFTNQDRSSFLLKYGVGMRLITRFHTGQSLVCGDPKDYDPERGPCERGIVDFVVGQDEAITGGYLRHFVFKIDGVHPLPIAGSKILYIFGSVSLRFTHNTNFAPLILQSASLDSLTKSGPDPSVFVLPLKQPDRDFYRYGVGLNLTAIFSKLSSKSSSDSSNPAKVSPSTSQIPSPGSPTSSNPVSSQ